MKVNDLGKIFTEHKQCEDQSGRDEKDNKNVAMCWNFSDLSYSRDYKR